MKKLVENTGAAAEILLNQANAGKFSKELNENIKDSEIVATQGCLYITADISGKGGLVHLLTSNTNELPGISSFSGTRLPANKAAVGYGIGVFYGKGNADKVGDCAFNTSLIAQLLNANLIVKQKGNELLNLPVSDLTSKAAATNPNEQVNNLDLPLVLPDATDLTFQLEFPEGSSVPAGATADAHHLVKIKVWSIITRKKG